MERLVYKAVVVRKGIAYTLGMGKAAMIPLSCYHLTDGGKYGISAAKSESGARAVIGFILKRKVKLIPKGKLMVLRAIGERVMFENKWRIIFRRMQLWDDPEEETND